MGRTYSEVVLPGQPMRATHVSTLRTYIDQDKGAVPPAYQYSFSWSNITSGAPVLAKYFTEMRQAIQLLWNFKGRGPLPNWSQEAPAGPSTGAGAPSLIRASHVTDLRRWLNQYEDNHPDKVQGVNSLSYDPTIRNSSSERLNPIIQDDWAQEVAGFSSKTLYVRCNIQAPINTGGTRANFTSDDKARYRDALYRYEVRGVHVFSMFTGEFFDTPGSSLSDPLDMNPNSVNFFTNSYIRGFADRAKEISDLFMQSYNPTCGSGNVSSVSRDFIIWNEPNVEGRPAKNFAALMMRCWNIMRQTYKPNIWWGGIFSLPGDNNVALSYSRQIYHELELPRDPSHPDGPTIRGSEWPWSGINIHVHRERSASELNSLFSQIMSDRDLYGDYSSLIVGEWGVTVEDFLDRSSKLGNSYNRIRPYVDAMFFFTHHRNFVPSEGLWGLRDFRADPNQYARLGKTNDQFYDAFDALMGS